MNFSKWDPWDQWHTWDPWNPSNFVSHNFSFQPEDWPYVNQKQFPCVHALVIPESEVVAILPEKTGSGYKARVALLSQVGGKKSGGNGQILATFTVEKSMIVITFLMRKPCR